MKTTSYEISYTDGRKNTEHDSYESAIAAISTEWPNAEIGHDGDLTDGGYRTLCWPDEESSQNDDGANAIASIRKATGTE